MDVDLTTTRNRVGVIIFEYDRMTMNSRQPQSMQVRTMARATKASVFEMMPL